MTSDDDRADGLPEDADRPRLEESAVWNVSANLLAGVLLGGAAGWGLDRLLGTDFIVGISLVVTIALTLYYVWLRYGTD